MFLKEEEERLWGERRRKRRGEKLSLNHMIDLGEASGQLVSFQIGTASGLIVVMARWWL